MVHEKIKFNIIVLILQALIGVVYLSDVTLTQLYHGSAITWEATDVGRDQSKQLS